MEKQTIQEPTPGANAAVYAGYLYRNNLESTGEVPAQELYNLCPDIIRSNEPVTDPQTTLTTTESLATIYDCDPDVGQPNYYYLRTLNGGTSNKPTELSLYAVPAQIIPDPQTWTGLKTASGGSSVPASAERGHYAVGYDPFVWTAPPLPADGSFYSFFAQVGSHAPEISGWHDLAQLMTQELQFGAHTVAPVDASQDWERALGLSIPSSFTSSVTLTLNVSVAGFDGCRLGIIASRFTKDGKVVVLNPVPLVSGDMIGFKFQGDPGYETTLFVQCWSGSQPVAQGSTIGLELTCDVDPGMLDEAMDRNLLSSKLANRVGGAVGPGRVMPVGAANFIAL
jgi:hypothetical protein